MSRKFIAILLGIIMIVFIAQPGLTLGSQGLVKLKKAGISDKTIQLIVKEKVIETAAFSVDDIVNMKKAGVGEETLQRLIKEGSFVKNSDTIVYGRATRPLHFTSAQDVIELKKAGLSDEVIQSVIAVSAERYYSEREEALDFLRDMDVRIDFRGDD